MTKLFFVLINASAVLLAASAQAGDAGVEGTIAAFGTAFNKGDIPAAKSTMAPTITIVDEVAPFAWSGPGAFDAWLGDLGKSEAAEGKTGGTVAISAPSREVVVGDHAYAIAPATYTFKQHGGAKRETAQMTFALFKTNGAWKIAAWSWTGPDAVPLK